MVQVSFVSFEELSTISSKGQTTVPKSVRQALGLNEGDQIAFRVDETGVTLRRATEEVRDPAIGAFLSFLARDIEANPDKVSAFPRELIESIAELTKDVEFDPDADIEGDVGL
jgi:antitoxin PrlF